MFGAGLGQLQERYTFYAVPLLVRSRSPALKRPPVEKITRCWPLALVSGAVFLPLQNDLFTALRDQSPVLAAFAPVQRHAGWTAPLLAGLVLLALALLSPLCTSDGTPRSSRYVLVAAALSVAASNQLRGEHSSRRAIRPRTPLAATGSSAAPASSTHHQTKPDS